MRHCAQCAWMGAGSRYKIVSWLRGGRSLCSDTMQQRAMIRRREACDTTGRALRHGQARPATRPGQACDIARPDLRHGVGCTQPRPRLGALCTRLSFDSMHCFQSLFWNTVHEHYSRDFSKKIIIIIFFKIN